MGGVKLLADIIIIAKKITDNTKQYEKDIFVCHSNFVYCI